MMDDLGDRLAVSVEMTGGMPGLPLGAVEEGCEEAVAGEVCAGEGAELAIAEEVGGGFGCEEAGCGQVVEDGVEGMGDDVGNGCEGGDDHLLVLFGFERAGGVEKVASGS